MCVCTCTYVCLQHRFTRNLTADGKKQNKTTTKSNRGCKLYTQKSTLRNRTTTKRKKERKKERKKKKKGREKKRAEKKKTKWNNKTEMHKGMHTYSKKTKIITVEIKDTCMYWSSKMISHNNVNGYDKRTARVSFGFYFLGGVGFFGLQQSTRQNTTKSTSIWDMCSLNYYKLTITNTDI